jgi:alpha-tubulin suppressor-like RCC1 family protein
VRAKQAAAGGYRSLVLGVDGTVWQWGCIQKPPNVESAQYTPIRVNGAVDVRQIDAGWSHDVGVMKLPVQNH